MGDDEEQAAPAPLPPGTNRVEITVGGRTVSVESAAPLEDVVGYALGIFEQTDDAAKKIPFGFDVSGGLFERAEHYIEPSSMQSWEDDHARGLDRKPSQDGATRRLGVPDPAGHHRTRLQPLPVDRGRAPVRGPRH